MNKDRRKLIEAVRARLDELQQMVADVTASIEEIRDAEQEYLDNMPESLQAGEKGDRAQEAIDSLEQAISELESIDFDAAASPLEDAAA